MDDILLLLDVDAIPLYTWPLHWAVENAREGNLVGIAQSPNHIDKRQVYVGPAFCCFSKKVWLAAGSPSFAHVRGQYDVGGLFSERHGRRLYVYPLSCREVRWCVEFESGKYSFGLGTTYGSADLGPMVYHQFHIRDRDDARTQFLEKCDEVLS